MGSVGTNVEALEVRIKELELENMSLKSQLDKYQTIFALQGETVGKQVTLAYMKIMVVDLWKRKFYIFSDKIFAGCNRNPNEEQEGGSRMGISAEPQSLKSLQVTIISCFLLSHHLVSCFLYCILYTYIFHC